MIVNFGIARLNMTPGRFLTRYLLIVTYDVTFLTFSQNHFLTWKSKYAL